MPHRSALRSFVPSVIPVVRSRMCSAVRIIALLSLGFALGGNALGQLSETDIEKLRERGKAEGWTFEVTWNEACQYSLGELCGAVKPDDLEEPPAAEPLDGMLLDSLPSTWDWRQHNGCTPIRNQGGCGSCWAFAAIGAVESAILLNEGTSVNLSEQWLVSCTDAGNCSGGWHTSALGYLTCNQSDPCGDCGPVRENAFPYVASNAACHCPYPHPFQVDGWRYVGGGLNNIEGIKLAIYDSGPVAVTVSVDSAFQGYGGGVFNACSNGSVNHVVVLVGWDDDLGSNGCWILRNSWGSGWGDHGYMYIEYGCSKVGGNATIVEYRFDCNGNGVPDEEEIANGQTPDCNGNGVPDECDINKHRSTDCNNNGIPDECEFTRGQRLYVDRNAEGSNTGLSWENALTDLGAAYCLTQTDLGVTEVWVARGVYTPCDGLEPDRTSSFQLINGVAMYGGFAGGEAALADRDLSNPANRTVLSGDLLGNDLPDFVNRDDNSFHVLICEDVDETAVLDGFVILGGYADGPDRDSHGGGLYNYRSSVTLRNCIFVGNYAADTGGGLCSQWLWESIGVCRPTLINCIFSGNKARIGGGATADTSTMVGRVDSHLINCTLYGNRTDGLGGGIFLDGGDGVPTLENSILWGNQGIIGFPLIDQVYGNIEAEYCCIQGWDSQLPGTGNTAANPLFADPAGADGLLGTPDDDLRLQPGSPAIDAGNNARMPADVLEDVRSMPRFHDDVGLPDRGNAAGAAAVIDMGAYEFQGRTCLGDLNGDQQVTLADLGQLLGHYGMSGATYFEGDLNGDSCVTLADLGALLGSYGETCE